MLRFLRSSPTPASPEASSNAQIAAAAAVALALGGAPGVTTDAEARAIAAALGVHLAQRSPERAPRPDATAWCTAGRLQQMNGRLSRQQRAG